MTETGGRGDRPEATGAGTGAAPAPGPTEDGVSKQHDTAAARPADAGTESSADAAAEPTQPATAAGEAAQPAAGEPTQPATAAAEPGQPASAGPIQPATDAAEPAQPAAAAEADAEPSAAASGPAQPAASEPAPAQPAEAVQPIDRKTARRAARRDRTRDAAAGKMQARSGGTAALGAGHSRGRRTFGAVAGAGILLLTGAAVAAGSLADAPGAATELPPVSAAVPAGDYTAVCPEPLRLLDSAADATDPQFSPVSTTAQTRARALVLSDLSGNVPGSELTELGEDTPLKRIAEPTAESSGETKVVASVVSGQELSAPTVLRADPVGETTALAGAAMTYRASDGDLRGLAAANCMAPANDFWLLGASTTVGTTSVLKLHNSSETPSSVNLELMSGEGPIQAAGTRGLLLAPGESRSIVLAGLAANQESLAVRVQSSGGPVTGFIQQSVLRQLTPGGVELLQASAPAGTRQLVTGITVEDAKLARKIREQDGYENAAPALEVAVPGVTDAVLEVRVIGSDGPVSLPGGGVITAAAGSVTRVPLDSLPNGTYSVEVSADVSIAAAARVSRATEEAAPVDFGWAPAAGRLGSNHLAVVPGGLNSRMAFSAPAGAAKLDITPVDLEGRLGKKQTVDVPAGTTVSLNPKANDADPAALLISASGEAVYGAQVLTSGGSADVAVLPVPAGTQAQNAVPVNIGY
ncbi:DUF5719 family protein [Arthrobacter sp. CAU 1506]|uniref:DUF5719 family protein n=1 Tax=Arthrobacter sp. CAU 1506 TaxID=2560052 RepID=UPI001F10D139|nr:DUF5719 family protein [Arthrobacter sp. CAU 1506]